MAPSAAMGRREQWLWTAAAWLPALGGMIASGGVLLGEDAYRYLNGAENFAEGRGVSTSLIHYDVERAGRVVPAPMTMHPAGYSVVIAGAHWTGLPLEMAAGLVSAVAFVSLIPILAEAARVSGITLVGLRLALAGLLLNSWSFVYPASATTESLFTALATAAAILILTAELQSERVRTRFPLIAASILVGVAYWVRYAGLLVFAGILTYYGLRLLRRRNRLVLGQLLLVAGPAAVLIGANAIRNVVLTGSWKSGYDQDGTWTLAGLIRQLAASGYHLVLGEAPVRFGPAELILAAALIGVAVLTIQSIRRSASTTAARRFPGLLGTVLAVYAVGLIAIGRLSFISFDTRMLYPLLPLILLAGAFTVTRASAGATRVERVALLVSLIVATGAYAVINRRSLTPRSRGSHVLIAQKLAGVKTWIDQNIPADAVIVASDGQATGYVLRRPTISLTPAEFSATRWTPDAVRHVMTEFNARFLFLYPGADPGHDPVQSQSAFLTSLLSGDLPDWLELAAESQSVRVFRAKSR